MDYIYKVWIAGGREHFAYGNGQEMKKADLPFAESLLELLYLDVGALGGSFESMDKSLTMLNETKEQQYADEVRSVLDGIAKRHIYFELLRLNWRERLKRAREQHYEDTVNLLPSKTLTQVLSNISTMQEQIRTLLAGVLDLDGGKKPVQEKMVDYYNDKGRNPLNTFRFQPQTMYFEAVDHKTFTEVLYPKDIYDIINYFVRECVKREQPMRVCKSCKRYFAINGRVNTEYCDRPIDGNGRTCKDVGAINLWNEKRKNDEVFKVYRREYKKRFSWIKAGKIEQDEFYAWSEKAREEKAKCAAGEISLHQFNDWLRES